MHHLIIILVIEPTWIARESTRHHGIHEARPDAKMITYSEMNARISRCRKEIPTTRSGLKITIDILSSPQAHIQTDTRFQGEEIRTESTQIITQHQGDFGIMETKAIRQIAIFAHLLARRMSSQKRIFQFHLCRKMVGNGQIGIRACREAKLMETSVMVAIHLAKSGTSDETGIETLCPNLRQAKKRQEYDD